MSYWTRRDLGRMALGAAAAAAGAAAPKVDSMINGVWIGVQSYSFRDLKIEATIQAMADIGLGVCEMWQGHIEPRGVSREELRQWRLTVPLDEFRNLGRKIADAGIELYAYNYSFRDDFTDAEIDRGFLMARALGARVITASSNVATAARIDPVAQKHDMRVGMHNHSRIAPNEFATPESFFEARKGRSGYSAINLDIGHFLAAGFDPVKFLAEHSGDILTLHIKDRKKDQGPNVPFGQGDTPIKEVLSLLREKKLKIPANIEYEYKGEDTVAEVRKCFQYCKAALGG